MFDQDDVVGPLEVAPLTFCWRAWSLAGSGSTSSAAMARLAEPPPASLIPILIGEARASDLPPLLASTMRSRLRRRATRRCSPTLLEACSVRRPRPGRGRRPSVRGAGQLGQDTAELFHGRGRETEELVERLRRTNLVMMVGDSGSGKSSLARAGLLPRFRGGPLPTHRATSRIAPSGKSSRCGHKVSLSSGWWTRLTRPREGRCRSGERGAPAQPRPKTGTRSTSSRKPMRPNHGAGRSNRAAGRHRHICVRRARVSAVPEYPLVPWSC